MNTSPNTVSPEAGSVSIAQPTPEWIRVADATRLFSIGRSSLFTLIRQKRIASKVLKTSPHNISGLRLISVESLRALIHESAEE
jgi:hypothetical protein